MKSKAHFKKCYDMGIIPVPVTVCDENVDKEALARLAVCGGGGEDTSSEEDESDGDESEESGSEEQEAAQSLLSLSQRTSTRLPGLLPTGRPTTYPYMLSIPSSTVASGCVVSTSSVTTSIPSSTQATAVIQNELSHRYYFSLSSSRTSPEESRSSVIQTTTTAVAAAAAAVKRDETDMEVEEITDKSRVVASSSQPIDLTTKNNVDSPPQKATRPAADNILTPVSEPALMQTIVQSMERLPVHQGREWKPDADGRMLQAYLTERHVMDSKMKQQYRVGLEREASYHHQQRCRNLETSGTATVTYSDPSKLSVMKQGARQFGDVKVEVVREKLYHQSAYEMPERKLPSPRINHHHAESEGTTSPSKSYTTMAKSEVDRSSMFNAMKMMSEIERPPRESESSYGPQEASRATTSPRVQETRVHVEYPSDKEFKVPPVQSSSRDLVVGPETKPFNQQEGFVELRQMDGASSGLRNYLDFRTTQETRPGKPFVEPTPEAVKVPPQIAARNSVVDAKRTEMNLSKKNFTDAMKTHSVARNMVVASTGFSTPSSPGSNPKPQAEFLQPSSGPAPNYVRLDIFIGHYFF